MSRRFWLAFGIALFFVSSAAAETTADQVGSWGSSGVPGQTELPISEPVQIDEHTYVSHHNYDDTWWFTYRYDVKGDPVPVETIPGGGVLEYAAHNYALLTGDFEVSLSDIIEAGLWPFNTFPEDMDMEMCLHSFGGHRGSLWDAENERPLVDNVGSPDWFISTRCSILASFYGDYFYRIIDTTHERSAEIGEKYPQFWTNPYTGEAMQEGIAKGDWMPHHVSMWRGNGTGTVIRLEVPDGEDFGLSFAEFTRLADEQNDPGDEKVEVKVDLSTLGENFPRGGTISVFGLRTELDELHDRFLESCLRQRIRNGIAMDYDFYVPQINRCDWDEEYIGHKFGSK